VKGHVTGPLTFTLGLNDSAGKPVYYDEELREVFLMGLKAKARWQADLLRTRAEATIIFVDEPIISALGSTAYMGVAREEALRLLREMVADIRNNGSMAGIHCCGRADWPLIIASGIDVLNFDAFEFGDTLAIYPDEVKAFLEKGGVLAWGIVPTTEIINEVTEDSVYGMFMERVEHLSRYVPEALLARNLIITPSCGAGARTKEETLKIFQLVMRMKEAIS
jgi:methionine synthase II (cobalamin-independent)